MYTERVRTARLLLLLFFFLLLLILLLLLLLMMLLLLLLLLTLLLLCCWWWCYCYCCCYYRCYCYCCWWYCYCCWCCCYCYYCCCWCYVYDSLSRGGILPTLSSELWPYHRSDPLATKTPSEAFGIHQSDICLWLIREQAVKLSQAGFGDSFLAETRESKLNVKTGTIINRRLMKMSSSAGQNGFSCDCWTAVS
jgi:hypothetical protein